MPWNAVYGVRIFTPHENHVVVSLVKALKDDFLFGIKVHYARIAFWALTFTAFPIHLLQRRPRNESDCVRKITQEQAIKSSSPFRTKHEYKLQSGRSSEVNCHW